MTKRKFADAINVPDCAETKLLLHIIYYHYREIANTNETTVVASVDVQTNTHFTSMDTERATHTLCQMKLLKPHAQYDGFYSIV